jgi:exosortase
MPAADEPLPLVGQESEQAQERTQPPVLPWVLTGLLALLLAVAYRQMWPWLWLEWRTDLNSDGGYFIPALSVFLVWMKWDELKTLPVRGSNWGLVLLTVGAVLYLIGSWTGLDYSYGTSFLFVLGGLILWLLGPAYARELAFPVGFLIFMLPASWGMDALTFPMRLAATKVAAFVPTLLGLPVQIIGTELKVGSYTLMIDVPCSGLRFLLAFMAGAALLGYLSECPLSRKVALFLCAFPVAFLGNILRIDLSLFLARGISEALAEGFFHSFSGVIVFIFGFILLYYLRKALCGPMPGDGPLPSDSS